VWLIAAAAAATTFGFYPRNVYVSAVLATATWLAGWLGGWVSVTRRYCIKNGQTYLKTFSTIW